MKKFIAIAAIAGFMTLSVQAQVMPERKNEGVQKERTERRGDVYKDLNLTKEQQQKLKTMREESRAQMEAIRDDNTLTQEQKKAKFDALREDQKSKMNAILTAEQRSKMDAKMQEMRANRKARGDWKADGDKRGMRNGADNGKKGWEKSNRAGKDQNGLGKGNGNRQGGEWMKDLNLTADQKSQMKALNDDTRTKMQSIRDNSSLTNEQKRVRFQELMKETQTKRRSILTAEQQAKWEMYDKQARANRPQNRANFQKNLK